MSLKVGDLVEVTNRTYNTYGWRGPVVGIDSANKVAPFIVKIAGLNMFFHPDDIKLADAAPDLVAHPSHYTEGVPAGVEVIDIIRAHMKAGGTWETANALKYILRHPLKDNPTQDIAKATQYLTMWTEQQEAA